MLPFVCVHREMSGRLQVGIAICCLRVSLCLIVVIAQQETGLEFVRIDGNLDPISPGVSLFMKHDFSGLSLEFEAKDHGLEVSLAPKSSEISALYATAVPFEAVLLCRRLLSFRHALELSLATIRVEKVVTPALSASVGRCRCFVRVCPC